MISYTLVFLLGVLAGALIFKNNPVKSETILKEGEVLANSLWDKLKGWFNK